tara:strand:- start:180 stop:392 length:213 start_codon:yes stop_codon:yes gene_type:complete
MSAENNIFDEKKNLTLMNPKIKSKISSGRVDINVLINRIRLEKQKENKTNLVFFGLIMSLVVVVGIILSF